jgi:Tfp pilus assembly protein PilO
MAITAATKWYAGAAAASLGILAAGYLLLVSPQQSGAADTTARAATVEQSNVAAQHKIDALRAEFKDLPTLLGQVAAIRTRIPTSPQEPTLLRSLTALAKSSGVSLVSVDVQPPTVVAADATGTAAKGATGAAALSQIPVSLDISGTYANTRLFLTGLESMRRSILVTGLVMTRLAPDSAGTTAAARAGGVHSVITAKIFMSTASAAPTVGAAATTTSSTASQAS